MCDFPAFKALAKKKKKSPFFFPDWDIAKAKNDNARYFFFSEQAWNGPCVLHKSYWSLDNVGKILLAIAFTHYKG